jgi:hypothetical protein
MSDITITIREKGLMTLTDAINHLVNSDESTTSELKIKILDGLVKKIREQDRQIRILTTTIHKSF